MLTEEEHRILRENEGKVFYLDVKSGIYSALYNHKQDNLPDGRGGIDPDPSIQGNEEG